MSILAKYAALLDEPKWIDEGRKTLNGLTAHEFLKQPQTVRNKLYTSLLWQKRPIPFLESNFRLDPKAFATDPGMRLRTLQCMGHDEDGHKIAEEANRFYFGNNVFAVYVEDMYVFRHTFYNVSDAADIPVPACKSFVKKLEIMINGYNHPVLPDLAHRHYENHIPRFLYGEYLEEAMQFANVEKISINICSDGMPNGCDLVTQILVKDTCAPIRMLFGHFGKRRLHVFRKHIIRDGRAWRQHDISEWWDAPSALSKKMYKAGMATFRQYMRIHIEGYIEWPESDEIVSGWSSEDRTNGVSGESVDRGDEPMPDAGTGKTNGDANGERGRAGPCRCREGCPCRG